MKGRSANRAAGKYGNVRSGGYASRKEHSRALVLQAMQQAGKIRDLREQVSYDLIPAQREAAGGGVHSRPGRVIERACRYVADFVYTDARTGLTVVEDAKGVRTPVYKIKKKLMLWVHGIRIQEV